MVKIYEYILFDIVGVLVDPKGIYNNTYLQDNNILTSSFFKNWSNSKAVTEFESGITSREEFAKARVTELDIDISPENLLSVLLSINTPIYEGVDEFLSMLSKDFKLACLSNTNSIHWNRITPGDVFDKYFQKQFLSYKIGYTKPRKEIYLHAIDSLNCAPDKIIFFDDMEENVGAALNCGLTAMQVSNFDDLKSKVSKFILG